MVRLILSSIIAFAIFGCTRNVEAQNGGGAATGGAAAAGAQGVAAPSAVTPNGAVAATPNTRAAANGRASASAMQPLPQQGNVAPVGGAAAPAQTNVNAFGQAQFGTGMNSRANPNGTTTADRMRTSTQPNTANQGVAATPIIQNFVPVNPNPIPNPANSAPLYVPSESSLAAPSNTSVGIKANGTLLQDPNVVGANGAAAGTVNVPPGSTATPVFPGQAVAAANVNTGNPKDPTGATVNPQGVASPTPGQQPRTTNLAPLANPNQWRFVNRQGQWWYWTPSNDWMYYNGGNWYRY